MRVRHVLSNEDAPLRELRLASLVSDPDAFGSTDERDAARPLEWWRQRAARSEDGTSERTFVLLCDDDRWLGLVIVRLDGANPGAAELLAMWVAAKARGRGASALLCDACASWARERGCEELRLEVAVDNERARRAYARAGFLVRRRSTWSSAGRSMDVVVMSRAL